MDTSKSSDFSPLSETTLYILVSLAHVPLHGYAIAKEVQALSENRVILSVSTLYTTLKRLLEDGRIERVGEDPEPDDVGRPRKVYTLTKRGEYIIGLEKKRLQALLMLVQTRNGGGGNMMALIQAISKIYSLLLCLFPWDFQNEFREEMEDVFTANLEDAAKTSAILVVRACFFELFDLPVNLVVEHLSNLRKGNIMKTTSFEISRIRFVLMGALGMLMGSILVAWGGTHLSQIIDYVGCLSTYAGNCHYSNSFYYSNKIDWNELQPWVIYLVSEMTEFPLPIIFCGLLLGIAAGVGRRAFLRIGLWTAVAGILGLLVDIPVLMVTNDILMRSAYLPTKQETPIIVLCYLAHMCVYGFFYGAGLGFYFDSCKTRLKFALLGLAANAVGFLTGYFIMSLLAYRVPLGPTYIYMSVLGILSGGILGWFFGKERQPETNLIMGKSNA